MGMSSEQEALKLLVLECAMRRKNGKCTNDFNDALCKACNCKLHLQNYCTMTDQQCNLMMLQAENSASIEKHSLLLNVVSIIIFIAVITFIAITPMLWDMANMKNKIVSKTVQYNVPPVSTQSPDKMINDTLKIVTRVAHDTNGDGLVNCIDAAVLFYQYYPVRSEVKIILNYNRETGMNHLFNSVSVDGRWFTVEPQAYYNGERKYWMIDYWDSYYDARFDRDDTERYKKYVR